MTYWREALVLVAFDNLKVGAQLRVDTRATWVQGVLRSGYIRLIEDTNAPKWEADDDSVDSSGAVPVSDGGVGVGVAGSDADAAVNGGEGLHQPAVDGGDGAEVDVSAGETDE